jgi:hypothetical protein
MVEKDKVTRTGEERQFQTENARIKLKHICPYCKD